VLNVKKIYSTKSADESNSAGKKKAANAFKISILKAFAAFFDYMLQSKFMTIYFFDVL